MATVSSTNPSSIQNQYQTYFSKQLLDYAVQALRKAEFAQTAPLPRNSGSKSIRFFRFGEPSTASVQTLTEGTAISSSNYRELSLENVDATLAQIGQVIAVTDILNATSLLNIMSQAVKTNGEDAALKCDTLIRDELVNNGDTDESDDRTKRYSGGAANWAALAALSDANGKIAATDLLDSVTNLKINRAPQIGGHYVMIAAPQVTRDLMNNTDWLEAHKYSAVQGLFKGEVGAFHGVKVIEDTNPYVEDADAAKGAHVTSGGEIYSSFVMGGDAFGVPALAGDSPKSPSVLITDTADKSDPLNQTTTIGWKAYYTAKVLNSNWFVVLRSRSAYS
mgnify:CR=1 FL=1